MIRLQQKLIDCVLSPMSAAANSISLKARNRIFIIAGSMVVLMSFFETYVSALGTIQLRFLYVFLFDCVMFGLMLFASLPKEIHPIPFDKVLAFLGIGFGAFTLIAGITKDTDHLATTILSLAVYPSFYLIWNNCDYEEIMQRLFRISEITFCVFLVIHILFFPITHRKYEGFFYNTNGLAFYLAFVFCCLMIELLAKKQWRLKSSWQLVLFGVCSALLYYTNSRTGQLAIIAAAISTVLLIALIKKRTFIQIIIRRILPMVISVAVAIPLTVYVFQLGPVLQSYIQKIDKPSQNIELVPDGTGAEEKTPSVFSAPKPSIPDHIGRDPSETLAEIHEVNRDKFALGERGLEAYSSGRIEIWKGYLQHLTFWGHSNQEDFEYERGGIVGNRGSAHMVYLEFAYKFGVLSALFLLLFHIFAGIKSIFYAVKHSDALYAIAPFSFAVAYGVIAVLATIGTCTCMLAFFYYLLQGPLMVKADTKKHMSSVDHGELYENSNH